MVRRGLQAHVAGKTITAVRVHHPRAVRRHEAGAGDLTARLLGRADHRHRPARKVPVARRSRLTTATALVVHLGMSGQMLLGAVPEHRPPAHRGAARRRHRAELRRPAHLRRLACWPIWSPSTAAGCLRPSRTSPATRWTRCSTATPSLRCCAASTPRSSGSCSTRPWCPASATSTPTRRCGGPRSTAPGWPTKLTRRQLGELLDAAAEVMSEALGQGGTSFDSLYVNVNGAVRLLRPVAERLRPRGPQPAGAAAR